MAEPEWSPEELGRAIRETRTRFGISISELARRSELAQSFLSQVELGRSDISVGRLIRVAQALEVRLSDLVEGQGVKGGGLVRAAERVEIPTPSKGFRMYLLSPSLDNGRTYAFGTLEVGAESKPAYRLRGSESFIYVVEGALRFELANQDDLTIWTGDTLSYLSDHFVRMTNVHDARSTFVWTQSPARYAAGVDSAHPKL